jgi:hypothetical protein
MPGRRRSQVLGEPADQRPDIGWGDRRQAPATQRRQDPRPQVALGSSVGPTTTPTRWRRRSTGPCGIGRGRCSCRAADRPAPTLGSAPRRACGRTIGTADDPRRLGTGPATATPARTVPVAPAPPPPCPTSGPPLDPLATTSRTAAHRPGRSRPGATSEGVDSQQPGLGAGHRPARRSSACAGQILAVCGPSQRAGGQDGPGRPKCKAAGHGRLRRLTKIS